MARTNIKIKRFCECCGKEFLALTVGTRYCSRACASKAYKQRKRREKILRSETDSKAFKIQTEQEKLNERVYLSVTETAKLLFVSRTTVYKYMQDRLLLPVMIGKRCYIERNSIAELKQPYERKDLVKHLTIYETDYYTTGQAADKYNVSTSWILMKTKQDLIKPTVHENKYYWPKQYIDMTFKLPEYDHRIKEWMTVEEIMKLFQCTKKSVWQFVYEEHIPRKSIGSRHIVYSRGHILRSKRIQQESENYYTVREAMDKYSLTSEQVYNLIKYHKLKKIKRGRCIKISKNQLDTLLRN